MTCFIAQNELSALVDEALEAARAAELQAHLAGCTSCSRELSEIRKVRTMLRSMPVHRAPPDFLAKVKAKAQKKSFLERVTAAVGPLLELPRPFQAGLALAASVVVAVTVFWNNPNRGLDNLGAAPGFREVAVAKGQKAPSASESNEGVVTLALGESENQDARKQESPDELAKNGDVVRALAAPPPAPEADLRPGSLQDKSRAGGKLAGAADGNEQKPDPMAFRALATPAPAATSVARSTTVNVPGAQAGGTGTTGMTGSGASSRDDAGRSSSSAGYVAPVEPGLYSSTPVGAVAAATPRAKADAAKPSVVPAKEAAATVREEEPSFDSAASLAEAPADDWAGGDADMGAVSQPVTADEKSKSKDAVASKKLERRDRESKVATESAGNGRGFGMETESTVAGGQPSAAPVAAAANVAGPGNTLSAKYLSAAVSAPSDVVEAAKSLGGRVVSPTGTAPGLGKAGASTVVIVEIPASAVAAFEEKLRAGGTLERGTLPSGTVRYRIEVVRQ